MIILPNNQIEIDLIYVTRMTPKSIRFNISEVTEIGYVSQRPPLTNSRYRVLEIHKQDLIVADRIVEDHQVYLISAQDAAILKTLIPHKRDM